MDKTFEMLKEEVNYFRDGMGAYFSWKNRKCKNYPDNPYEYSTDEHCDWEAGFNDAERFDECY